jgi:hypothetical protein
MARAIFRRHPIQELRMRRRLVVAVSSLALALALPASAHAQFGGLVRRAAERVVKKETSTSSQPRIDDATVTQMLAGLTEEARIADSIGRATLAENADVFGKVDGFLKRYATYSTARDRERRAAEEYQACMSRPGQELASMQGPSAGPPPGAMALAQRMESMSDEEREAFQAKVDKLEKEAKAAEKSGNVAEQQRIRGEIQKLTGMPMNAAASPRSQADIKKMQAAGARMEKCKRPQMTAVQPPEPILVRPLVNEGGTTKFASAATREIRDSLDAQAYLTSLRSMKVGNVPIERGATAAGMDAGRYALLRERVLNVYANSLLHDSEAHPSGFTDEEYEVLEAHRPKILGTARRLKELGAF